MKTEKQRAAWCRKNCPSGFWHTDVMANCRACLPCGKYSGWLRNRKLALDNSGKSAEIDRLKDELAAARKALKEPSCEECGYVAELVHLRALCAEEAEEMRRQRDEHSCHDDECDECLGVMDGAILRLAAAGRGEGTK